MRDKSPWAILTNLGAGRMSHVRTLTPNLMVVALKMWARMQACAKIAKIVNFWYKFAQKRYIPLSNSYKIWYGRGAFRPAPSCQISPLSLLKCGLTAPKIPKIVFGIILPKWSIPLSASRRRQRSTTLISRHSDLCHAPHVQHLRRPMLRRCRSTGHG